VAIPENVSARRSVGRYRLYGAIAVGGMATVHYGRMQGPLGFARTVAVKRLHPELARDPEFVAMFMDEARLAARVHHPNVVQTLDVVAADGELFLVMEYVPALSLAHLLHAAQARKERAPPAVAAAVIADVLRGLHAAHEATDEDGNPLDIVHRDVSPQNILVGAEGCAMVLDFGIAKATGRSAQATRDGQVKGKFAYMAPEQVTNVRVTRQSDIFAASVVLWETLTGARLFQAESEPALLARVLSAPIECPSRAAAGLGEELDGVLMRGLSRDLSARYATAREMAIDLDAHLRLASPSQVGEWVERLAGDELATRSMQVAEIENESRSARVSVSAVLEGGTGVPAPAAETDARRRAPGSTARRSAPLLVAVSALVALGAGAAWVRVLFAGGAPTPPTEVRLASQPASPLNVPAPPPAEIAAARESPVATEAADSTPPTTAGAASVPKPPRPSAAPALTRSPLRSPKAQETCDPPYYVDPSGHLIYRPDCFR
jgi:eukaryotic-like serine/threonine-protein kinase